MRRFRSMYRRETTAYGTAVNPWYGVLVSTILLLLLSLAHAAPDCAPPTQKPAACFERAWPKLTFEQPVWFGMANGQAYVLERVGRIHRLGPESSAKTTLVADLSDRVNSRGQEEGLLGIAFHPNHPKDSRVYLYYTAAHPKRGVLSEFELRDGRLDPKSERIMLEVGQPFANHNGGALLFDSDGMLLLSLGDGGAGGDPFGHGQNPQSLLGTILRVDVEGLPYSIPGDNPFADGGPGRPEVWAWGLRNVWRIGLDTANGEMWAGDVGQNRWEEVNQLAGSKNYGWNIREGQACFRDPDCTTTGLTEPVHVYGRNIGVSITMGPVYRGTTLPALIGAPLFGDFGSGTVWSLCQTKSGFEARLVSNSGLHPAHFGADKNQEIVLVHLVGPPTNETGALFRMSENCSR